jgi:hypothetical protein
MSRQRSLIALGAATLDVAALVAAGILRASRSREVKILTATPGGTYASGGTSGERL